MGLLHKAPKWADPSTVELIWHGDQWMPVASAGAIRGESCIVPLTSHHHLEGKLELRGSERQISIQGSVESLPSQGARWHSPGDKKLGGKKFSREKKKLVQIYQHLSGNIYKYEGLAKLSSILLIHCSLFSSFHLFRCPLGTAVVQEEDQTQTWMKPCSSWHSRSAGAGEAVGLSLLFPVKHSPCHSPSTQSKVLTVSQPDIIMLKKSRETRFCRHLHQFKTGGTQLKKQNRGFQSLSRLKF